MSESRNRPGVFSLIAGLASAGLLLAVAAGALVVPGLAQLPPGLVIGAGAMMLGAVVSGLAALVLGVIGIFGREKKGLAVAGALIGGGAVALLVLLVVIGQRVGTERAATPLPAPPALRPETSSR